MAKGLKLKVIKFCGISATFVEVTGEKLVGGILHAPCAFHFVEIFHFVEMQSVICLYFHTVLQTKFCNSDPSFNINILTSLYLKSELLRMRNHAITRLYILYTNFTTWCLLETYIEDTIDKWHQQATS